MRLYHYCVMSNHVHLLVQLDDPRRLSALMAGLLLAYARSLNRRHGFVGHLSQGRFKSPLVQRDGYWLSCGRYLERNPVRAGLAGRAEEWPWSSLREWLAPGLVPRLSPIPQVPLTLPAHKPRI